MENRLVIAGFKEGWGQERSRYSYKRTTLGVLMVTPVKGYTGSLSFSAYESTIISK